TEKPIAQTIFDDTTMDLSRRAEIEGKPIFTHRLAKEQLTGHGQKYRFGVYAYRVRAVDRQGRESGPSPYVLTIPSAVEYLFSKESGGDCQVKWLEQPERGETGP